MSKDSSYLTAFLMGRWYPSIEVASVKGDHSGTPPLVSRSRCAQTQVGVSGGKAAFAYSSGDSSLDQTGSQCWAGFSFQFQSSFSKMNEGNFF